jgi:deazaflavin-dependent oxidoreductase (nitroreductase family)
VANLRAHPEARVTIDGGSCAVVAEEILGAARSELWARLTVVWPRIEAYERRAGRDVPVFRLRPVG